MTIKTSCMFSVIGVIVINLLSDGQVNTNNFILKYAFNLHNEKLVFFHKCFFLGGAFKWLQTFSLLNVGSRVSRNGLKITGHLSGATFPCGWTGKRAGTGRKP